MKRSRNSIFPRIALALALTIPASIPDPFARAADEKATDAPGRIAFFAWFKADGEEDEWGVFVVDPTTNVLSMVADLPIKNGPISLADFRLSRDGQRLAFGEMKSEGSRAVWTSVWLRDLRPGAELRKISDIAGRPVAWSTDGKALLVVEYLGNKNPEKISRTVTWKIDDDGSNPVRLPLPDDFQAEDWSADGRWLVGIRPAPGKAPDYEVVVMHPDGTDLRSLTGPGQRYEPRFSPDSRRVAFVESSTDPSKGMKGKSIGVVELDGKDPRRVYLEPDDAYIEGFAWSPDGKRLVTKLSTWTRTESGVVTPLNPRIGIIDVADGRVRFVPHPRATSLGRPQWR